MKLCFFVLLLISYSLSAMERNEQPIVFADTRKKEQLERRCIKCFMAFQQAKDLHVQLGTQLIAAAKLEDTFSCVPKVQKKIFSLAQFLTNKEYMEFDMNSHFDSSVINHAGTHVAIPLQHLRVHIVGLDDKDVHNKIISFKGKFRNISTMKWSFDDHYIALLNPGRYLNIYDVFTGGLVRELPIKSKLFCWHPHHSSHFIMFNDDAQAIEVVDVTTGMVVQSIPDILVQKNVMQCSPDGTLLAFTCNGNNITILNLLNNSFSHSDYVVSAPVSMLEWSADGRYIAYNSLYENDAYITVLDVQANKMIADMPIFAAIVSIAWRDDGKLVIIVSKYEHGDIYSYKQIVVDPRKVASSMLVSGLTDYEDNGKWKLIANPLYDEKNNSFSWHSSDLFMRHAHLSNQGKFLIGTKGNIILIYDYSAQQQARAYLQSQIPLNQAIVLLAIFKSSLKNERLLLDSSDIKAAFAGLPDFLREPLSKWVRKSSWADPIYNLTAKFAGLFNARG